jgi:hypothetical protein
MTRPTVYDSLPARHGANAPADGQDKTGQSSNLPIPVIQGVSFSPPGVSVNAVNFDFTWHVVIHTCSKGVRGATLGHARHSMFASNRLFS